MPEHVRVDLEANLGFVTGTREEFGEALRVNGPPRSEAKTKGEADWRLTSRSARNSSPRRGCVAALPPLAGARALCRSRMRSTTALMASALSPCSRHELKHLDANVGYTTIRNPQATRGAERKVEDAVANPWSAVGDHNHY